MKSYNVTILQLIVQFLEIQYNFGSAFLVVCFNLFVFCNSFYMEIGTRTLCSTTPFKHRSELALSEYFPLTGITRYVYELSFTDASEHEVRKITSILLKPSVILLYFDTRVH